jgi:hypothetical protein
LPVATDVVATGLFFYSLESRFTGGQMSASLTVRFPASQ